MHKVTTLLTGASLATAMVAITACLPSVALAKGGIGGFTADDMLYGPPAGERWDEPEVTTYVVSLEDLAVGTGSIVIGGALLVTACALTAKARKLQEGKDAEGSNGGTRRSG